MAYQTNPFQEDVYARPAYEHQPGNGGVEETSLDGNLPVTATTDEAADQQQRYPTRELPLSTERRQTDVPFLCLFVIFAVTWIETVIYAMSTRSVYRHDIIRPGDEDVYQYVAVASANATSSDKSNVTKIKYRKKYSDQVLQGAFVSGLLWYLVVGLILGLVLYLILKLVYTRPMRKSCKIKLAHIVLFYIGFGVCDRNTLASTLIFVVSSLLNYAYSCMHVMAPTVYAYKYLRYKILLNYLKQLSVVVMSTIIILIALTTAGIQYTKPHELTRYFILFGGVYAISFVLSCSNLVIAQITATYHRSSPDAVEQLAHDRITPYLLNVGRYHLGSVALSATGALPVCQASMVIAKCGFITAKYAQDGAYEFLYRIYLVLNLASYAEVATAVSGVNLRCGMEQASGLLLSYCAASANALSRVLDSILSTMCALVFFAKFILPTFRSGFEAFSVPSSLSTDLSVWITLAFITALVYAMKFALHALNGFAQTTRLCLLEDKVEGKAFEELELRCIERQICFDFAKEDDYGDGSRV